MARGRMGAARTIVRLVRKNPMLLLIAAVAALAFYANELLFERDKMTYMGIPKARELSADTFTRTFRNQGYMVGYSDLRGNPLWVVYKLNKIAPGAPSHKRPDSFSPDWRNLTFVNSGSYTGSGYDRGHMAPNSAISKLYGKGAQKETFLMTNITPQRASLNQHAWQRLEEMEREVLASKFDELWVFTGPIFDEKRERLKSSMKVEIPDAFYKVFAGVGKGGKPQLLAFVFPQNARKNAKLEKFIVSVDEVEKLSGFDFFHELDDELERNLEAAKNTMFH